jgi:hypothetical protein
MDKNIKIYIAGNRGMVGSIIKSYFNWINPSKLLLISRAWVSLIQFNEGKQFVELK